MDQTVYLIIGLSGIILLVLGMALDGVLDFLDDSILPASGVALTVFGASGLIASSLDTDNTTQLFWVAFTASSITTVLFIFIWKTLRKRNRAEDILEIKLESVIGTTGEVVDWGKSSGDAIFEYLGSHRKLHIVSDDPLKYGDKVVAKKQQGNGVFVVEKVEE